MLQNNFFYAPHKSKKFGILLPHIAHTHTNIRKVKQESCINYKHFTYSTTFVKNIIIILFSIECVEESKQVEKNETLVRSIQTR